MRFDETIRYCYEYTYPIYIIMKHSLLYILLFSFLFVSCAPKEEIPFDVLQSQLDEIENQLNTKEIQSLQKKKAELEGKIAELDIVEKQPFYIETTSSEVLQNVVEITKTAVVT